MDTDDDLLTAHGRDLDRLLAEWEPVSGVCLSDEWLAELERAAEPREALYGPDRGAHQQFPRWTAARAAPPSEHPNE